MRWVKLQVAAKQVRTTDAPVPAGGCPAPSRTILCRLRGRNWVAVQVALAQQRKRVTLGDKRPSYGACPKPKRFVPTAPAPTVPPPTTTTVPTTTTTVTTAATTTVATTTTTTRTDPLAATATQPLDNTCTSATTSISATATGGAPPYSASLEIGGALTTLVPTVTGTSFTFNLDTTQLADGTTYAVDVAVHDSLGASARSAVRHVTVDRSSPTTNFIPPPAIDLPHRPLPVQLHASDACGIASVQFILDASPVGNLLTEPDSPSGSLYTITFDASTLTAGSHSISAVVTDGTGNTATANPSALNVPFVYVPVLNYHGILGPHDPPDTFDLTTAGATAQLAYLQANGYRSINLEQYQTWLATGALPAGVDKPVLITVDDGTSDELAWDPLLRDYGFTAVLFEVTGYADNTTPGAAGATGNMSWAQVQTLAGNGRWQIAFHAGVDGHADFSDPNTTIDLGGGQTLGYPGGINGCWAHYTCLGTITTAAGSTLETPAQFETQIASDITAGMARLKEQVPSASLAAWACPWNACGQWTTDYNDPTHAVDAWLPGFFASQFPIVFMQTDPTVYGDADELVGSLTGENRRYRFEVRDSTTIAQFAAALTGPAFAVR